MTTGEGFQTFTRYDRFTTYALAKKLVDCHLSVSQDPCTCAYHLPILRWHQGTPAYAGCQSYSPCTPALATDSDGSVLQTGTNKYMYAGLSLGPKILGSLGPQAKFFWGPRQNFGVPI